MGAKKGGAISQVTGSCTAVSPHLYSSQKRNVSKLTEWGERKATAKTAGSSSCLRNWPLLPANEVNETCNLILSDGEKQALMVSVTNGLSYVKRLPT